MITFAADLTTVLAVGHSLWGKGPYGEGHYSRVGTWDLAGGLAPSVSFSASFDIVGQDFLNGDLRPVVTFAGALSVQIDLGAGGFVPAVAFDGDLTFDLVLGGGVAPQIAFTASLTFDLSLEGDLPLQVGLACPEMIAGPLWADTEPCPSPPWAPSDPCPPPPWMTSAPCDPVWSKSRMCNG